MWFFKNQIFSQNTYKIKEYNSWIEAYNFHLKYFMENILKKLSSKYSINSCEKTSTLYLLRVFTIIVLSCMVTNIKYTILNNILKFSKQLSRIRLKW